MKLQLYLDTSVFSARFDDRAPDRQRLTEEFWASISTYELSTSDLAVEELRQTADPHRREQMESLLKDFEVIAVNNEMRRLAGQYIQAGAFTRTMLNDAIHVAAATHTRQDILLSWNFKHLVNRRRRAMVCSVNAREGLPLIDILSPPEL
jgi:predicted nucleic acid-binding protein